MNFFENEIAKYERRIEAIERRPNPQMMASNKLFYEALLDHNRCQLEWWREGKPFYASANAFMLMRSFGDFQALGLTQMADRLGGRDAERCMERVRAMGLPDYACDRTVLLLPLAIIGDELPKPSLVVTPSGACEVMNDVHRTLARLTGAPFLSLDVPFSDPYQENLTYVARQMEEFIGRVEASLPGAKYDEDRLLAMQQIDRRWCAALHDIYELRKRVPCPDHPRDVFREPLMLAHYSNPARLADYYEAYRDELRERADRGYAAVGEEKLRIVWSISGPYGSGVWDYLAKRGVSVPYWHYGQAQRVFAKPYYGDETEFGRKLTPIEEEARKTLYNSWAGSGERWLSDIVRVCREFQADGLVQFEQTWCQPTQGLGQLATERVQAELGIPSWRIEGRQLLGHTERAEAEFIAGLEAFVNLCFDRKNRR